MEEPLEIQEEILKNIERTKAITYTSPASFGVLNLQYNR